MTLGTKAEYARQNKVSKANFSKPHIKKLLESAMEPDPNNPKRQLLNFEKADKILEKNQDPSKRLNNPAAAKKDQASQKNGSEETQKSEGYADVRTRHEQIKVQEAELNLLERKGQTLMREEVIRATASAGQVLRERLQTSSRTIAEKAATMTSAQEIKSMLDDEYRSMLQMVSDDLMRKLFPAGMEPGGTTQLN